MSGEAILITGVGRRIGLYLAERFRERGHHVIGTYRQRRESIDKLAALGVELHACDFTATDQLNDLIGAIKSGHSSLRAIIHNASLWLPDSDDPNDGLASLQHMMQVHVHAPFLLNRALSPLLENTKAEHADIIHLGDYVSSTGSPTHAAYAASKAAQDNLTYSFASRYAPKIKVNSIAPALILFNEGSTEAEQAKSLDKSLMHKEAGLEEFGRTVDYLMGSAYVTGRVLALDGGRHLKNGFNC